MFFLKPKINSSTCHVDCNFPLKLIRYLTYCPIKIRLAGWKKTGVWTCLLGPLEYLLRYLLYNKYVWKYVCLFKQPNVCIYKRTFCTAIRKLERTTKWVTKYLGHSTFSSNLVTYVVAKSFRFDSFDSSKPLWKRQSIFPATGWPREVVPSGGPPPFPYRLKW